MMKVSGMYLYCYGSSLIYAKILSEGSGSKASTPKGGTKGAQKAVEKLVLTKGKPILLFLDEIDQLGDANNQVCVWERGGKRGRALEREKKRGKKRG